MAEHPIAHLFSLVDHDPSPEFASRLRPDLLVAFDAPSLPNDVEATPSYLTEEPTMLTAPVTDTDTPGAPPRHRSRRWMLLAAGGAAAALLAGAVIVATRGDHRTVVVTPPTTIAPTYVVGRSISVGGIDRTVSDGTTLWAVGPDVRTVTAVDAAAGRVSRTVELPSAAADAPVRLVAGRLDVLTSAGLVRIDTTSAKVLDVLPVGANAVDAVSTSDALWVLRSAWTPDSTSNPTALERWNATGTTKVATVALGATEPGAMLVSGGSVWVSLGQGAKAIDRVDATTNTVSATIPSGYSFSIVADPNGGAIWAADYASGTVNRIDPSSNGVIARVSIAGSRAHSLALAGGTIWATAYDAGSASRIDTSTNTVTSQVALGVQGRTIATVGPNLWVAGDGRLTEITPAR